MKHNSIISILFSLKEGGSLVVVLCAICLVILLPTADAQQWTQASGIGNSFIGSLAVFGNNMIAGVGSQEPDSIFTSTDHGKSWSFVLGDTVPLVITSMAAAGTDLVVGSNSPGGSYFSTDAGHTWEMNINDFPNPILSRFSIGVLTAIGDTIFAATGSGVFQQVGPGADWMPDTIGEVPDGDFSPASVVSLLVSGSNFFAGTRDGGAYRSTNEGGSWSPIDSGLPTSYFDGTTVAKFAIKGSTLFAIIPDTDLIHSEVYYTTNEGQSWSKANDQPQNWNNVLGFVSNGQNLFVAADSSVYVSSDNGVNWAPNNDGFPPSNGDAGYIISMDTSGPNLVVGTYANGVWVRKLSDFPVSSVSNTANAALSPVLSLTFSENPASNAGTKIVFTLPAGGIAQVMILDELGRTVRVLQNGMALSGQNELTLDPLAFESGTYFVRLAADGMAATQKLVISR
jgi:photosystem II stability/assembly factor-like uncharacterized protein